MIIFFLISLLEISVFTSSLDTSSFLCLWILTFTYIKLTSAPKKAPDKAIHTAYVIGILKTLIASKEPIKIIVILTTCSITWLVLETPMILCPCKYPLLILKKGTIKIEKETVLIASATSS